MNDLLERYLAAVCSYFIGPQKEIVYQTLKTEMKKSAKHYDDLEDLIIQYGHPRSVALSYGYRPYITHIYNQKIISKVQKYMFALILIYLIFSTLFSFHKLDYLPFLPKYYMTNHNHVIILWILSHPTVIIISIIVASLLLIMTLNKKYPVTQSYDLVWNHETVAQLPHPSRYPSHMIETILIITFSMFFLVFYIYFHSSTILRVQNATYQMIHLLNELFQPFVIMILLDCIVDLTKRTYSKQYLKYSSFMNIFVLVALTFFIIRSNYLNDFLLPMEGIFHYIMINFLIFTAIVFIAIISLYKLIRNLKYHYSLFKK